MSFTKAIKTYRKNYDAAILFALPLLLSILLVMLYSYPMFTSLGGIFLRVVTLEDMGIGGMLMIAAILIMSIALLGTTISAISLIVRDERSDRKVNYGLFVEALKTHTIVISIFYILLFLLLEGMQLAVFMLGIDTVVYSLLSIAVSYVLFFAPFAMVVDDYSIPRGVKAGIEHLAVNPLGPLKWFVLMALANLVVMVFFGFFMDYGLAKIAAAAVNGLVLLPFMIIYGAHMYVDKYPMTRG
jgi:hypothetical protein